MGGKFQFLKKNKDEETPKVKKHSFKHMVKVVYGRITDAFAGLVIWWDKTFDDLCYHGERFVRFWSHLAERNKGKILKNVTLLAVIVIALVSFYNYATGYEYSYKGQVLGVVKNQNDVEEVLDLVSSKMTSEYNTDINLNAAQDIEYKRVITIGRDLDDSEEILESITYMQEITTTAWGIYVDGKRATVVATETEAHTVLSEILEMYKTQEEGVVVASTNFKENVEIRETEAKVGRINTVAEAEQELTTSGVYESIYVTQEGDTVASIAEDNDVELKQITAENVDVDLDALEAGDKVVIKQEAPVLTVVTVEIASYTEVIPYESVDQDDPNSYIGTTSVGTAGENGSKDLVATVTRENGVETDRVIESETITKEPVTEVILIGSKEIPPTMGDGSYCNPCPAGYLSSPYGYRWGRTHRGIDLACATGNPVYAADGGVVTKAGWSGSYGNLVEIDHKNGVVTRYAHNSALLVSVGDEVIEGQQIAKVGSTGNSTGAHCHFEMEINGTFVNPLDYVSL